MKQIYAHFNCLSSPTSLTFKFVCIIRDSCALHVTCYCKNVLTAVFVAELVSLSRLSMRTSLPSALCCRNKVRTVLFPRCNKIRPLQKSAANRRDKHSMRGMCTCAHHAAQNARSGPTADDIFTYIVGTWHMYARERICAVSHSPEQNAL